MGAIELAAADLAALVQELQVLEDGRFDKFYQRGEELIIHVYVPGDRKYRLVMSEGRAFLSRFKREMPERPPGFCMFLRKKLGGAVIERVEQYDFDRVLELHTDGEVLVAELFGDTNFVLTNKNQEVQAAMRNGEVNGREIVTGEAYVYPSGSKHPSEVDADDLRAEDGDLVVALASGLGLGGRYAEEVVARAGVAKGTPVADLTDAEVEAVLEALHGLFERLSSGDLAPRVYYDGEMPQVATPVPFESYGGEEETFDTFSAALDHYFTEREKAEYRRKEQEAYREKKEKLERRLEQQERKLEGLEGAVEENREKGDLIYENYTLVEDVLDSIRQAREAHSEDEIERRLESEKAEGVPEAEAIEQLDLGNGRVVVDIGMEVALDLDLGVEKNAEQYYEKSKASRSKTEGVEAALEETRRELEALEKEDVDVEDAFTDKEEKRKEKKWYEKFRWFRSSDGFLVIGGRDTTTNDMIVKKYMEPHDVYVHAEFTGAPSVVIRTEGEEPPESTLEEAGQLAVTFARSWDAGVTSEDAYHVDPEQVTQEAESGEYLPKGSFVIRGEREYMNNLPVAAAVGLYERDDGMVPMGGPPSAVEAHCDHHVVVEQGREKPSDVAKEIKAHLEQYTDDRLDLDRVIRALPPGKARVAEKH